MSLTVIDYTSDHDVSDVIWIHSQKYVIERPLASQESADDFENWDHFVVAVKVQCRTGATENPPHAVLKIRGATKLTQHVRTKAEEFVYRIGPVQTMN